MSVTPESAKLLLALLDQVTLNVPASELADTARRFEQARKELEEVAESDGEPDPT